MDVTGSLKSSERVLRRGGGTDQRRRALAGDAAQVTVVVANRTLRVEVRDDGIGGADREGHRLQGMADRVAALRGRQHIDTSRAGGTRLAAEPPLAA
jgi:glucose-6-phosphate-specific signal transduction histidine kinase